MTSVITRLFGGQNVNSNIIACSRIYYSNYIRYTIVCEHRNRNQQIRNYALKSDLKIKWVRPPKIPCIQPEKSGDLKALPPVDLKHFPLEFSKSEELKTADDLVKRLFTLEFTNRNKSMQRVRNDLVNSVKRHALDKNSMETKIACMTGGIRDLQEHMDRNPKDKVQKVRLKELIDKRKKCLKFLRQQDYKRFEWLLEKLDLVYRPPPEHFHWVTRKESLQKLTNKYCEDLKQERLAAYRERLEAQKVDFLREKAAKLKWMIEEEKACGGEPSVTEGDVEQVLKQLKDFELTKASQKEQVAPN